MLNRRNFIKVTGALTLLPIAGRLASAVPLLRGNQKFFVMIRVFGGMDVTLGLDPWLDATLPDEKDMFVEYKQSELIQAAPEMKLGPAAKALVPFADRFSIVNGLFMSQVDNGHGASMNYVSAGTTAGSAPALPVEISRGTQEGDFGILTNTALTMGNRAALSSSLLDLKDLPNQTDVSGLLDQTKASQPTPFFEAIKRVLSSRPALQTFINNMQSFGPLEQLSEAGVMAAAFMSEVAFTAQFDLTKYNLDSHAGHPGAHLTQQTAVWTEVADIFKTFAGIPYGGTSLFDHTTFMVVSEFARTPALNSAKGKDHNPLTNSVLLAGRGIVGGKVIGASRLVTTAQSAIGAPYHIAYPIDYSTFEVQRQRTPNARMIFPENIAQTVAEIMEVDFTHFRSIPAGTLPLKALMRS